MQIENNKVVRIEYTLRDEQGQVLDTSDGGEPLGYIHGVGNLIPGLEAALDGKAPGEELSVAIPPEQAYGQKDAALVQPIAREMFGEVPELKVGMQFQAQSPAGPRVVTIVGIEGDTVTVDGNHPLAGMTLNFDVKVVDIRDATEEELAQCQNQGQCGSGCEGCAGHGQCDTESEQAP